MTFSCLGRDKNPKHIGWSGLAFGCSIGLGKPTERGARAVLPCQLCQTEQPNVGPLGPWLILSDCQEISYSDLEGTNAGAGQGVKQALPVTAARHVLGEDNISMSLKRQKGVRRIQTRVESFDEHRKALSASRLAQSEFVVISRFPTSRQKSTLCRGGNGLSKIMAPKRESPTMY